MNRSLLGVAATLLLLLASTASATAAPIGSPVLVDRPEGAPVGNTLTICVVAVSRLRT